VRKYSPVYLRSVVVDAHIDAKCLATSEGIVEDHVYLQFVNQSAILYCFDISGQFSIVE